MNKPHLRVIAAIIKHQDRILCARRAPDKAQGGLWEFPGGKVESGETDAQCLQRELREELSIETRVSAHFNTNIHEYDDKIVELVAYWVEWRSGEMTPVDHDELKWLPISQLNGLDWAPADVPFIHLLQR